MSRSGRVIALAALAFCVTFASSAIAGQYGIARDGTVHRVTAGLESGVAIGSSNPILHFEQSPSGEIVSRILPGTRDGWSCQPQLEIDPVTDEPIVVWTRIGHGNGDIYVSRYAGSSWSTPVAVAVGGDDDRRPSVLIGADLVHVAWERSIPAGANELFLLALDRTTLGAVSAEKALPTDVNVISLEGGSRAAATAPAADELLFVAEAEDPDSSRVLIVFGIREEPMPVGYAQGFLIPEGVGNVSDADASWSGSRLVLSFVSGNQLYYTVLDEGAWSELRRVNLDSISAAAARHEIDEMLARSDPG